MTSACDAAAGGVARRHRRGRRHVADRRLDELRDARRGGAGGAGAGGAAEPRRHLRERRRRLGERRPQRLYHARDALPTAILLLADLAAGQGLHRLALQCIAPP